MSWAYLKHVDKHATARLVIPLSPVLLIWFTAQGLSWVFPKASLNALDIITSQTVGALTMVLGLRLLFEDSLGHGVARFAFGAYPALSGISYCAVSVYAKHAAVAAPPALAVVWPYVVAVLGTLASIASDLGERK